VKDRFDAEYYRRSVAGKAFDIAALRSDIEEQHKRIAGVYKALEDLETTFDGIEMETVRLGDLLEKVAVRETLKSDVSYKLLGVRWWGEGAFVREEKLGREIKAKAAFRVSPGWIIYNRLFAFRGSFAITTDEHEGCYVSGEFPTYTMKSNGRNGVLINYIVHCLNSPQYLAVVDKQSTGSTKTSRNRFNEALFEDLILDLPKEEADLKRIVGLLDKVTSLRASQERQLEQFKTLREGVLRMLPNPS
jgi:type I restriction enzyme M protein